MPTVFSFVCWVWIQMGLDKKAYTLTSRCRGAYAGLHRRLGIRHMAKNDLQGTLDLLVLKTLQQAGSLHGYGIALHIQQASDELLRVEEGSLYPALHRIEKQGWISAEWTLSETNRRAKFYKLTAAGQEQLSQAEQEWHALVRGVSAFLQFA
jgi:PadR family transcriptional regulator, regulatory protein PadR